MSLLALAPDEAHLWYVRPERVVDPRLLAAFDALLEPAERERGQRYRFPHLRHQFLVTRALQRSVLSRYAAVAPADWRFVPNRWGRPDIAAPDLPLRLRFNLSHADGLVACLVAADREVGVDVEHVERSGSLLEIADRYFAPREVTALRALPQHAQRFHFFDYWTLKESYIKARGMGLAIPLDHFAFALGDPIEIHFEPELPDDPARWRFELFRPDPSHTLATCVSRKGGDAPRIVMRETIPLADV